jgi:hypothetical protein
VGEEEDEKKKAKGEQNGEGVKKKIKIEESKINEKN